MAVNTYSPLWFELFMPLQTEEGTEKDAAFLARQLPLPRYRRVLDLCCGYGRHSVALAARGYSVTGLDRNTAAIEEARRRTVAADQVATYVLGDMREIDELPGAFDAIINMWQSLSYFDEATNSKVLRQIGAKLEPAGRFVVDMYNRDYFMRNQGHRRQQIQDTLVETHGYLEGNRWHSVLSYKDMSGELLGGDHMEWQVFTPDEFVTLAGECGFVSRLVCGFSNESIAPSSDVPRVQLVLEKR